MKTKLKSIVLLTILVITVELSVAQSWNLFASNTYTSVYGNPPPFGNAALKLGTADESSISFITHGTEKFRLYPTWGSFSTPVYFNEPTFFKDGITGYQTTRLYDRLVVTCTATPTGSLQIPNSAYFSGGNVIVNNDLLVYGNFYNASDKNLKKNIKPINSSLETILKITPYTYSFDREKNPGLALPAGEHFGVIAQEIQQVLPHLVSENNNMSQTNSTNRNDANQKHLSVNYIELIPLLIGAIKEQNQKIEDLVSEVESLKEQALPGRTTMQNNSQMLSYIEQNKPNPVSDLTTIKYHVSQITQKSEIKFFNDLGTTIKTIEIKTRGTGEVSIGNSEFKNGIYFYQLINDGKIVDTKKMIIN